MIRRHPGAPDIPIQRRRQPITRKPRTSDRQQPCRVCGQPWAIGFDHTNCKEYA